MINGSLSIPRVFSPPFTSNSAEEKAAIEAAKAAKAANSSGYSEDAYTKIVDSAVRKHQSGEKKKELLEDMKARTSKHRPNQRSRNKK